MKRIITLSAVAFLSTVTFANTVADTNQTTNTTNTQMQAQIDALTAKVEATTNSQTTDTDMQAKVDELTAKITKLEKKQKSNTKNISKVNKLANKDNIKFDVDFRTSWDNINYKTAGGAEYKNHSLYSNRLWLGMGYAPTNTMFFKGQLSFNKALANAMISSF